MPLRLTQLALALVLLLVTAVGSAWAQQAAEPSHSARLEAAAAQLDQAEATLKRENLSDRDLESVLQLVEPIPGQLRAITADVAPRLQSIDSRLAQIGPKPAEGAAPESPDITRDREEQTRARQPLDETMRRVRLIQVRYDQLVDAVSSRQRDLFATRVLQRSSSILAPQLWYDVALDLPRTFTAIRFLFSDWSGLVTLRLDAPRLIVLAVTLVVAFLLAFPARKRLRAWGTSYVSEQAPGTRLRRTAHAIWVIIVTTAAPIAAALVIYYGLQLTNLVPPRAQDFLGDIVRAVAFVAFVEGLSRGILAPNRPSWRLPELSDSTVDLVKSYPASIASVFAIGSVLRSFNDLIGASLSVSIVTNGLVAIANALTFALALKALRAAEGNTEDEEGNPQAQPGFSLFSLYRAFAWIAITVVVLAAVAGYVALAGFLATQVIWLALIGTLLYLLLAFVDDLFTVGFTGTSPFGRIARQTVGLRATSIEQIGILLSGLLRLILIVVAIMFAVAPWGIGRIDALVWLRGAVTGFSLGGFYIAPGAILGALLVLVIGIIATRAVQRWLAQRYLPRTRLDEGLKNSIQTGFGYLGVIIAGAIALSSLGLGLDKLAIVAGALSVGIGFGLQSIVNNFVSGLILLAERPIKVGDWVAVGTQQGNVKRISVRSTEVELFDRSTLIVPNSELITGQVQNFTHQSPLGRVWIKVGADYDADPEMVRKTLVDIASAHPLVLDTPEPAVNFTDFGDNALMFDLFCFVPSPRQVGPTASELRFTIFKAFAEKKIGIPYPQRDLHLRNTEGVEDALKAIAAALQNRPFPPAGPAGDQPKTPS